MINNLRIKMIFLRPLETIKTLAAVPFYSVRKMIHAKIVSKDRAIKEKASINKALKVWGRMKIMELIL